MARGRSTSASIGADGSFTIALPAGDGSPSRLSIVPLGAKTPRIDAIERQTAVRNVLVGRDPSKWRRGLPLYGRVRATNLYPGIDAEYYGSGVDFEYDFVVTPGAKPSAIRLRIDGGRARLEADGALVVSTPGGTLQQLKPVAYQVIDGTRRDVAVSYRLEGSTLRFSTGPYDDSRPLVIDPVLVTSTYTGSATYNASATPVKFTGSGLYVGGTTSSDLYIAKYTIDGRTLLFETVFGGSGSESFSDMAVDEKEGAIYAGGVTRSDDLPSIGFQVQGGRAGGDDGFLAKFSIDGSTVLLSMYVGTRGTDSLYRLALGDDLYVSMFLGFGESYLPTAPAFGFGQFLGRFSRDGAPMRLQLLPGQSDPSEPIVLALGPDGTPYIATTVVGVGLATAGAFQTTPGDSRCFATLRSTKPCSDVLVAHYSADLSARVWATYLRETSAQYGNAVDVASSIAVDSAGNVIVAGETLSTSFPITPGAFDSTCVACNPPLGCCSGVAPGVPFVTKLNPAGSGLIFSTFVNGNNSYSLPFYGPASDARVGGVSLDALGNVFLTGWTWNPSFAAVGTPLPQASAPTSTNTDAFLTAFSPTGTALYSSRFGGDGADTGSRVRTSSFGTVALGGSAGASFPLQDPVKTTGTGFLAIVALPGIHAALDVPAPGGLTRAANATIRGWAVDSRATVDPGIDSVDVTATPSGGAPMSLGPATLGASRPDVALAFGSPAYTASGFTMTTSLAPGTYTLTVTPHSSVTGTSGDPITAQVTALAGTVSKIQSPSAGTLPTTVLTLKGFAVDLDAPSGTGVDAVHVWAFPASSGPVFLGVASYGETRSDLTDMFGAQFAGGGFSLAAPTLTPGTYTVAAYAHSTVTGTFSAVDTVTITVPQSATELYVSVPVGPSLYQGFTIGGWAIDSGAPTGTGVDAIHVWAFPAGGGPGVFLGATTTFIARPDVAAARGARFFYSGFKVKTASSLPPGDYQVLTFAHSTLAKAFNAVDARPLTVLAATGPVFQLTDTPDGIRVKGIHTIHGYAFDPRAAEGLGMDGIHMYVYPNIGSGAAPVFVGLAGYGGAEDPALNAHFGVQFASAGVSAFLHLDAFGPGTHLVALFAHSTVDGSFTAITRRLTLPAPQLTWAIEAPQPGAVVTSPVTIRTWAIDRADVDVTPDGDGVQMTATYFYPVGGGAPIGNSGPCQAQARPDVVAAFGESRFLNSGLSCTPSLAPGTYDMAFFMFSDRTNAWSPPVVVRFTVQ
jgi:hypothetical protein